MTGREGGREGKNGGRGARRGLRPPPLETSSGSAPAAHVAVTVNNQFVHTEK